ncbi:MAG: glycosyltransferase [Synechococcaceae cyanobacterium ELA263]
MSRSPAARPSVRLLCQPDLDVPSGGGKQLYRHVEHLVELGWDAAVVTEAPGFRPSWFESSAPSLDFASCQQRGDFEMDRSIVVLPETYLGVNLQNYHGVNLERMARVVFNQNAYYSYRKVGLEPLETLSRFYDAPEVLQVLCVSEDSHQLLRRNLGLADNNISRIINAIEPIFQAAATKRDMIHWLPRKNPEHALAILLGMRRGGMHHARSWQAEPLHEMSHADLAERLNQARIFLSFGHPEGFGLPVLEAMAAGCWVVGYSGGGADELFRLGPSNPVSFGDWQGFLTSLQQAMEGFALHRRHTELRLARQVLAIRSLYSRDQEAASIQQAWERILQAFHHWQHNRLQGTTSP